MINETENIKILSYRKKRCQRDRNGKTFSVDKQELDMMCRRGNQTLEQAQKANKRLISQYEFCR